MQKTFIKIAKTLQKAPNQKKQKLLVKYGVYSQGDLDSYYRVQSRDRQFERYYKGILATNQPQKLSTSKGLDKSKKKG